MTGRSSRARAAARRWAGAVSFFALLTVVFLALWVVVPMAFGLRPNAVSSGSMAPVIRAGDVVLSRQSDGAGLGPGTVVLFESPQGQGLVTHRIVSVTPEGHYVTKGDGNSQIDSDPLPPSAVIATGRLLVPMIALPAVWAQTGGWLELAGFVVLLAAAIFVSRWVFIVEPCPLAERLGPHVTLSEADAPLPECPDRTAGGPRAVPGAFAVLLMTALFLAEATGLARALFADVTASTNNSIVTGSWAQGLGTAVWQQDATTVPEASLWQGAAFGAVRTTATTGEFRIMASAVAPTRDEALVVGVTQAGTITGEMWNGASWAALPFNPMATVAETFWWSAAVGYEAQSGDAVVVWDNGTTGTAGLSYRVWNGTSWSSANTITTPASGEPKQIRIASDPTSDELVLVASNSSSHDYAIVWSGSSWGNSITLDTSGGDDRTDVYVDYERAAGRALVVYGKSATTLYSRTWNGTAWSGESTCAIPAGASGNVRWTVLGAQPGANRVAIGVITRAPHVWLAIWDGSAWGSTAVATLAPPTQVAPTVAVAFEGSTGEVLATYGESSSTLRYRTFVGGGWSAQLNGPGIGGTPNSMLLYPRPGSNEVMLAVQDNGNDLNYLLWSGSAWGAANERETNTGETKNQPFTFLWGVAAAAP